MVFPAEPLEVNVPLQVPPADGGWNPIVVPESVTGLPVTAYWPISEGPEVAAPVIEIISEFCVPDIEKLPSLLTVPVTGIAAVGSKALELVTCIKPWKASPVCCKFPATTWLAP
jgi:hypothetical protein